MENKRNQTYKTKGLDFFIINASDISHAVRSFLSYRIGVTENDIELFEGKIPKNAHFMSAIPEQEITTREQALEWWSNLPFNSSNDVSKTSYCAYYFGNREYTSLTGREIEEIWRKENSIATIPDEYINTDFDGIEKEHSIKPNFTPIDRDEDRSAAWGFGTGKPNQKQFKQFDAKLFKAYIDKFSDEDKMKAIELIISNYFPNRVLR